MGHQQKGYTMTPTAIATRCGYPPPAPDRRVHRRRTLGWQALTVHAVYLMLHLPRPVASGRGGRHRAADPNDATQLMWAWA